MSYELAEKELACFPTPEPIKNYKLVERRRDWMPFELHDDRSWKREFQDALDNQTKQIDKLLEGLKEEREARKAEDTAIRTNLESMSDTFASLKLVWVLVAIIIAAVLGGVAGHFVPMLFGH